jgi:hypothetical protein
MHRPGFAVSAALVFASATLATSPRTALAAVPTFTVNSLTDAVDQSSADNICKTSTGDCTVRAAIQQAATLGGEVDVNIPAGQTYTLTIPGPAADSTDPAHGDLDVLPGPTGNPLTLVLRAFGTGIATIQGQTGFDDRILDVRNGAGALLYGIRLSGGHASGGGGIKNAGWLTLAAGSAVTLNTATDGGGIFNDGSMEISNTSISGNHVSGRGGGIFSQFGTNSYFSTTIAGNSAAIAGGGIYDAADAPYTNLQHTTISGNSSLDGGGIYLAAVPTQTASILSADLTISGNHAFRNGGGVWSSASFTANNDTIAFNIADSDGDGVGDGGGMFFTSGTVSLANTILAANVDAGGFGRYPDCLGTFASGGYNLIGNITGCAGSRSGDLTGRDPRLGPLQNNGGAVQTHALLANQSFTSSPSPAIDAGTPSSDTKGVQCSAVDARLTNRPHDGNADGVARCDIGAYELQTSITLGTFSLDPGADASVAVGEHVRYSVTWTVPSGGWRQLDTLQLRFVDPATGSVLWLRFNEVAGQAGTFSLVDPRTLHSGPAFAPSSAAVLGTAAGALYLAGTSVIGPPGPVVTVTLDLVFKPAAEGRVFDVEVLATSDTGIVEGFNRGASLSIN